MQVTVKKNHFRQSPKKIRPALYLVKNKRVDKAMEILTFSNNKASRVLLSLLKSGVAAAKEKEMEEDKLYVKNLRCDQASRLKRYIFKARGRTARITKRNSHLVLTLCDEMVIKDKKEKIRNRSKNAKSTNEARNEKPKKSIKKEKSNKKENKNLGSKPTSL